MKHFVGHIRYFLFFLALLPAGALAAAAVGLQSKLPSSIKGIDLPNAHYVSRKVVRGNQPINYIADLKKLAITDVLIFKNSTRGEVELEQALLVKNGWPKEQIYTIPFRWKNITSDETACRQTVEALSLLLDIPKYKNRKIFFHCTVGEDRTGLLAGLFRMVSQDWSSERAFRQEMCTRGYEAGSPVKQKEIVDIIRSELTPIFTQMAEDIESGKLTKRNLSLNYCNGFVGNHSYSRKKFTCRRPRHSMNLKN